MKNCTDELKLQTMLLIHCDVNCSSQTTNLYTYFANIYTHYKLLNHYNYLMSSMQTDLLMCWINTSQKNQFTNELTQHYSATKKEKKKKYKWADSVFLSIENQFANEMTHQLSVIIYKLSWLSTSWKK